MGYSNDQLIQMVAALTNRVNSIEQAAKKTEELPLQDPMNDNSLIRVGDRHISIKQILNKQNNRINTRIVFIDWTQDEQTQLINHVNNNGLSIANDEIWFLQTFKADSLGNLTRYYYLWTRGSGNWGEVNGNEIFVPHWFLLSVINTKQKNTYNLGEIGTDLIENVVNTSGPYPVTPGVSTLFTIERSGEPHVYVYIGNVDGYIGLNETQTTANDFVDLTEAPIPPSDPSDYVTISKFDNSLYDTAETGFSTSLNNFTSLTEKFYFLRISGEGNTVYFASKESNSEDFVGSRIYISATDTKHNLGAPAAMQNGYHFWDIGVLPVTINPLTEDWKFNFWPRPTPASTQHIVIEGSIFEYRPKPGNDGSEFQIGDLALNGWVDDVFADKMRYTGGDPELFSGWEVVEWAVDNW